MGNQEFLFRPGIHLPAEIRYFNPVRPKQLRWTWHRHCTYEGIQSRESLHPIKINTRLSPCLYGDLNHVGRRVGGDRDLVGKLREENAREI